MGYRDDFYKAENMIGYSGSVSSAPTVYFQDGNEFGHITQKHDLPQNVGRMEVYANANYVIENVQTKEGLRLIERIGDQVFHVSRGTLKRIEEVPFEDQAVLLQAIRQFPNEKPMSQFSKKDLREIDKAMAGKARVLQELVA